ncbi:MAG: asparaginase [Methyloceanibacter sp.]|uniref:asparaginase n=1 Tax=Methyloceanibacter sp. TaxID=1965321 RepID=UPI003D6CDB49
MTASDNPVLVDVHRGSLIESQHRGAIAVADADGRLVLAFGDVERPIYPRSAVKALQAIPLVESGAADAFGLSDAELAVACASHSGDQVHLDAVAGLLAKAGLDESHLACGAHWPVSEAMTRALLRGGKRPGAIHNNCSGKHAGMLAAAVHLGYSPRGYEKPDHPLQVMIARILSETCGVALDPDRAGIDGCSLPTHAVPLMALARGFARFGTGWGFAPERAQAAARLKQACFAAPVLVAGEGRFDTVVLRGLAPLIFVKGGAEGVHCAALPDLGLGLALKIDDGAKRGTERVMSEVLAAFLPKARNVLADQLDGALYNWRGLAVGRTAASAELRGALDGLAETRSRAAG